VAFLLTNFIFHLYIRFVFSIEENLYECHFLEFH